MIGHTEKVTSWGTGLEQQVIGFLTFTLRPYLKLTEQAVKRSLIPASERDRLYAEFNIEGLLRADSAGRAAFYASMAQNGIMTRNEIRGKENLSPMPGGDELTFQSNLIPARMAGQNAAPPQQAASGDPDAPRLRVVKA
jgi:HK97 family phage portal protein